jgi:hypothetical protein
LCPIKKLCGISGRNLKRGVDFMALKNDLLLKELDEKLAFYCKEKNYSFIVSIMAEDFDEGNIIACNGDISELLLNIVAFSKSIEKNFNLSFRQKLLEILAKSIYLDSNDDKKSS